MMTMLGPWALAALQDTVAYVPKPSGPPDSSGYMWAGYAITVVAIGGYLVLMWRRMARERRARQG